MTGMAFPPGGQTILDALNPSVTAPILPGNEEEWQKFLDLVAMHRLGPLMHERLAQGPSGDAIPAPVKERLQQSFRRTTLRNLAIGRQLVRATSLLRDAGISSVALKGAFLAFFAYRTPALRPMRDLDLLVQPQDAVRAFEVLKSHGYRSALDGTPEAYFADRIHLPPLVGPDGIPLELHHRLTPPDLPHFRRFEEHLWSCRIGKTVGGIEILFPRAEDMLLHLCIHATLDHQLDVGPLALMDIAMLVETESLDWHDFLRRVDEGRWGRCVLPPLLLAERHLRAKIPQTVIDALGAGEGSDDWVGDAEYLLFSDSSDHKVLDYGVQDMLYSPKWSERLARLVDAAFPPRAVIARHFLVRPDSVVAYFYYPLRWYRLATGKMPALFRAYAAGAASLRQLATRRAAFIKWLSQEPGAMERR
jgi:hypothetical protein